MFSELYKYIESVALVSLFVRLLKYSIKDISVIYTNIEVVFYIVLLLVNNLICNYWPSSSIVFSFFHAVAPVSVILGINLRWLKRPIFTVVVVIIASTLHLYFLHYGAIVVLYITAILSLLFKVIKLARRASKDIQKSSVYLVLALDLLFSLKVFVIAKAGFGWEGSVLIEPMWRISLIIFALTIIVLHVKLRRFFIA